MVCLFFQSHLYYHPTVKSPIGFSSSLASLMNQLAGIFLTPDKLVFTFYVPQANGPQLKGSLLFLPSLIRFPFFHHWQGFLHVPSRPTLVLLPTHPTYSYKKTIIKNVDKYTTWLRSPKCCLEVHNIFAIVVSSRLKKFT